MPNYLLPILDKDGNLKKGIPSWLKERYSKPPKGQKVDRATARMLGYAILIQRKRLGGGQKEIAIPDHIRSIKDAIEWGERKIAELSGLIEQPKALVRFEDLGEEVIASLENQVKSKEAAVNTLTAAKLHIRKHLIPWFNDHAPYAQDLNYLICNETFVQAQRRKDSERYLGNDIKYLRRIVKRAALKGLIPSAFPLKSLDEDPDEAAGTFIPFPEQDRLLTAGSPEMRVKCALGCLAMRNSETRVLRLNQIHGGSIMLEKHQSKTRKSRRIWLTPWAEAAIDLYRTVRLPEGAAVLFPSRDDLSKPVGSHKKAWTTHRVNSNLTEQYRFHDWRVTALTCWGLLGIPYAIVGPHAGVAEKVYRDRYLQVPAKTHEELEQLLADILARVDRFVPLGWRQYLRNEHRPKGKVGEPRRNEAGVSNEIR